MATGRDHFEAALDAVEAANAALMAKNVDENWRQRSSMEKTRHYRHKDQRLHSIFKHAEHELQLHHRNFCYKNPEDMTWPTDKDLLQLIFTVVIPTLVRSGKIRMLTPQNAAILLESLGKLMNKPPSTVREKSEWKNLSQVSVARVRQANLELRQEIKSQATRTLDVANRMAREQDLELTEMPEVWRATHPHMLHVGPGVYKPTLEIDTEEGLLLLATFEEILACPFSAANVAALWLLQMHSGRRIGEIIGGMKEGSDDYVSSHLHLQVDDFSFIQNADTDGIFKPTGLVLVINYRRSKVKRHQGNNLLKFNLLNYGQDNLAISRLSPHLEMYRLFYARGLIISPSPADFIKPSTEMKRIHWASNLAEPAFVHTEMKIKSHTNQANVTLREQGKTFLIIPKGLFNLTLKLASIHLGMDGAKLGSHSARLLCSSKSIELLHLQYLS